MEFKLEKDGNPKAETALWSGDKIAARIVAGGEGLTIAVAQDFNFRMRSLGAREVSVELFDRHDFPAKT